MIVKWYLIVILIGIFLVTIGSEHLLICLLAICFLFSSSLLTVTGRYIAFVHIDIYLQARIYGVLDSSNRRLLCPTKIQLSYLKGNE